MRRRDFLRLTTSTTAIAFAAAPSFAQQSTTNIRRIGVLLFNSPQTDPIGPFLEGLKALGYAEGKTSQLTTHLPMVEPSDCPIWPSPWSIANQT
jgi:hypothetical protein